MDGGKSHTSNWLMFVAGGLSAILFMLAGYLFGLVEFRKDMMNLDWFPIVIDQQESSPSAEL